MSDNNNSAERAEFYKSHRDRSAVTYKKKHGVQYDWEFGTLTGATPSMSILEIGCGAGNFLRYLEASGYAGIVGIDMDEYLYDVLADLKTSEIYLDDVAHVLAHQLKGRKFDRIVLLDVAEHIEFDDLVKLLTRLRTHLNDNGKMLLRVPNIESPWGLKMFYGTFDHVTPLGSGRIRELAHKTGWTCEGCFPQEPRKLLRRLKERLLHRVMGSLLSYHPEIWTANLLAVYQKNPDFKSTTTSDA
jgi:2-polyprenyl-3-methyl-5-hydroxy-6-metoxy-1,4-benzoquinol methylase